MMAIISKVTTVLLSVGWGECTCHPGRVLFLGGCGNKPGSRLKAAVVRWAGTELGAEFISYSYANAKRCDDHKSEGSRHELVAQAHVKWSWFFGKRSSPCFSIQFWLTSTSFGLPGLLPSPRHHDGFGTMRLNMRGLPDHLTRLKHSGIG